MRGLIFFEKSEAALTDKDYSVKRLLKVARERGIQVEVIVPNQLDLIVGESDRSSLLIDGKRTQLPDFVLSRTGSHTTYYGLAVMRHLEHAGVLVCNSAQSVEIVKDKLHIHQLLAQSNLPTPKTMLVKFPVDTKVVKDEIGFPLVIKNITGTEGSGIYLCDSEEKFVDVMELIYSNNEKANIILQEFMATSRGRDLRVFVLGGRILGCIERSSQQSFKANFSRGGVVANFELTSEIEWLSTETTRLLGLDIAGIDLLFDEQGYKVCEANSSPGFMGFEKVHGAVVAEQILDYVQLKLEGHL